MTRNSQIKIIRYVSFLLALAVAVLIFSMSSQSSSKSSATSGSIISAVAGLLNRNFDEMTLSEQTDYIQSFQFIVRKAAHFSVYALLSFFLSSGFLTFYNLKKQWRLLFAYLIAVLYAVSDEIHQFFVPGRSCELRDVIIDSCGALLGLGIVVLIYLKKEKNCQIS